MKIHFNSLRARLTFWFLAVTVLSLATVVTIIYFQRASAIRDEEFVKLQVVRDLKVVQLSSWIEGRADDLIVAAGDHEIRALEIVFNENGDDSQATTLATARGLLQRHLDHYSSYKELFVINASSGAVVISTDASQEGSDMSTASFFTEPLRTRQAHIEDIYYSETEQRPAMAFSIPIFCLHHEGEHLIGVLVARVDLDDSLFPLLEDRTGMGETGETLIVNQDVLALNDLRWHEDAVLKLKISAAPAVRAAQGETGIVETGDYRGEQVLAAYTHIPQTGWGFVAKRDLDEIYAPIRSMLESMVLVAVVVILFVIVISLLIARSISNPVRDLTRATTRMAGGEQGVRVDVHTGDELEVMTAAFNQMASKLDTAREEVMARDWLNAGITGLDDVIRGEKELSQLCTDSITMLARYLDVQVGTLSLADHGNAQLTLTAHYAYQEKPGATTTFGFGEGLVGQAALEKKQILINEVSDAPITITSALGAMAPRSILCLPLLYEGEVAGVIELGSLHPFTELQQEFLQQIEERLAIAIRVAQSRETQKALLEETQAQSEELQTQQEELRDSNEELEGKSNALTAERAQSKEERRKS